MDAVLLESGPTSRLAAAHSADKNFRGEKEFVSGEGSCHPERVSRVLEIADLLRDK